MDAIYIVYCTFYNCLYFVIYKKNTASHQFSYIRLLYKATTLDKIECQKIVTLRLTNFYK